ncbi:MAG: hypothetical protein HOP16_20485 [Acidobacteria bacterium]|nr:hypothetical protein [Acidobacteriota bacterium]
MPGPHYARPALYPQVKQMQRTREELDELLRKSQEDLKKSRAAQRKLKAVMTKVNKVVGRRKSVKRKVRR